jgi:hypothetical protein
MQIVHGASACQHGSRHLALTRPLASPLPSHCPGIDTHILPGLPARMRGGIGSSAPCPRASGPRTILGSQPPRFRCGHRHRRFRSCTAYLLLEALQASGKWARRANWQEVVKGRGDVDAAEAESKAYAARSWHYLARRWARCMRLVHARWLVRAQASRSLPCSLRTLRGRNGHEPRLQVLVPVAGHLEKCLGDGVASRGGGKRTWPSAIRLLKQCTYTTWEGCSRRVRAPAASGRSLPQPLPVGAKCRAPRRGLSLAG